MTLSPVGYHALPMWDLVVVGAGVGQVACASRRGAMAPVSLGSA